MRIVIATANKTLLNMLSDELDRREDIDVVGRAASGAIALGYAEKFLPDAILTDLVMPGCDGLSLLERLPKLRLEKTPLVFMMLLPGQERIGEQAMQMGLSDIIEKPINADAAAEMMLSAAAGVKIAGGIGEWYIYVALNEIGVPRHLSGFKYLYDAIALSVADRSVLSALTTTVYPYIAKKYNSTKSRVERSMRFAIESAWNRGRVDKIDEMFGYTVRSDIGRPTNGEFIAMMAERVRVAGVNGQSA